MSSAVGSQRFRPDRLCDAELTEQEEPADRDPRQFWLLERGPRNNGAQICEASNVEQEVKPRIDIILD